MSFLHRMWVDRRSKGNFSRKLNVYGSVRKKKSEECRQKFQSLLLPRFSSMNRLLPVIVLVRRNIQWGIRKLFINNFLHLSGNFLPSILVCEKTHMEVSSNFLPASWCCSFLRQTLLCCFGWFCINWIAIAYQWRGQIMESGCKNFVSKYEIKLLLTRREKTSFRAVFEINQRKMCSWKFLSQPFLLRRLFSYSFHQIGVRYDFCELLPNRKQTQSILVT